MWQKNQTKLTRIGIVFLLFYSLLVEKPYLGQVNSNFTPQLSDVDQYITSQDIYHYETGKMKLAVENPLPKKIEQKRSEPSVAVFAIPKQTPQPTTTPTPTHKPQIQENTTNKTANIDVAQTIRDAASEYNVDANIMIAIAECESGFRSNAVNGQYAGIFQFHPSTWQSNRRAMGLDDSTSLRFDPNESAKTAAFKMSRDGYGAWPACSKKALDLLATR